jgi:hypothetical protein
VVLAVVLLTFAVLAVIFTVAAVHKNQQIDELHSQGVPVTLTVTSCIGLLGGSGSNAAGYSCTGTYALNGHHYTEPLPGTALHSPGTTVHAVAVPNDPTLMTTARILPTEHSSWHVYILPAVLFAALLLVLGLALVVRRHRGPSARAA